MPTKEIIPLYRIYDIKNKEYVSLDEYFVDGNGIIYQNEYLNLSCCGDWSSLLHKADNQDDYIVERCSGLKDKNKKLVYQNDIVYSFFAGRNCKVEFHNGIFMTDDGDTIDNDGSYEIIGTIHQENTSDKNTNTSKYQRIYRKLFI